MKPSINHWLTLPDFGNEKNRAAYILHLVLLISYVSCSGFAILSWVSNSHPVPPVLTAVALFIVTLITNRMLNKGYTKEAGIFFTAVVWLVITPANYYFDGIHSAGVFSQIIIIVIAGLVISRRAAWVFAILASLALAGLAYAEDTNLLPVALAPNTIYGKTIHLVTTIFVVTALIDLALNGLYKALELAHQKEQELAQRNTELAALSRSLEQNISQIEQAQLHMKIYAAELENSNRELQDFAYVVSHDLQAPLRKIQAFGDRLHANYSDVLDDRGKDYVNRMQNSAARMQQLIQDLLTFSRITTQARPFTAVPLNELIQTVLLDLETRIEDVDGRVQVDPLPTIQADPTQMRQLFQNLISNALKFHQPHVPPFVQIKQGSSEPDQVKILVIDNGIGFEQKYSERIFQVFQRLHGINIYEGTGIGLAICKRIIERHHGELTAVGLPNQGSTFTITLPITQPPLAPTPILPT